MPTAGYDEQAAEATCAGEPAGAKVILPPTRRLPAAVRTALPDRSEYDWLLKPMTIQSTTKGASA
ncbi:hypothetical protein ACFU7T_11030 [Streptomyces sp. NPDC057555]|uniref:hypothetical protein n=1 Tax=Streptomyces sp. NPDC057555 TaxID=3346166 RepID=UPI003695C648